MTENGTIWGKLDGLELDILEWLEILEEEGRRDSQVIWGRLSTKKVLKLVEALLTDFKGNLVLLNGKDKKERGLLEARAVEFRKTIRLKRKELRHE